MANTAKAAPGGPSVDNRPADDTKIVNYRLDGVKYTDADKMPDGGLCISLSVRPLRVDWEVIGTVLEEGGIDRASVPAYVDKIAMLIEDEEMARSIAKRLRRLG